MNEIYWITRLDTICNFLTAITVVSFLISAFTVVFVVCNRIEANDYEEGGENWNYYYIKSNDTAKQLPDKCVKALDKYLDNLTKEEKQNDNESK